MSERTVFSSGNGIPEMFCTLTAMPGSDFTAECKGLFEQYLKELSGFVPVWVKLHLSDVTTQAQIARSIFGCFADRLVLVGQPPANGARIALESWNLSKTAMNDGGMWHLENYDLRFYHTPELSTRGSCDQMNEELLKVDQIVAADGGSIEKNLHRTWIYCRDVDNNYAGLVDARRKYFEKCGMLPDTHYIASTGIEGQAEKVDRLVRMDSLLIYRQTPEQIQYLYALENLSPTHIYGVTFERATRIIYGDRSHYYISGTASIDNAGNILYPGDVRSQTERAIDNIEALLAEGQAVLSDMKQAIIYLRDAADAKIVSGVVDRRMGADTGRMIVRAPVCRPGWLVEIEGIAVNRTGNKQFKDFV